ncbi:hypothetical protein AS032_26915 [Rhodococcus qingshengii]|nr:hypothetical protein AS032_26915 [Rhodococcus qingshengii]
MGRDAPFGPDLMKTVQSLINADFSIARSGSVIHKLLEGAALFREPTYRQLVPMSICRELGSTIYVE